MKKSTCLEQALTPDGQTVTLHERDGRYSLRIGGVELMTTRQHASEEALAEATCAEVAGRPGARVLIGGLGFGFTLRAALRTLGPTAEIVVAELLPCVVAWNRNPAYPLAADALADPRVVLREIDVVKLLAAERGGFDAVLLDVDNGPAALSSPGNESLYDRPGLKRARAALRPGGCLGVWSVDPSPAFEERLRAANFEVEVRRARAHTTSGNYHTLFLARLPADG